MSFFVKISELLCRKTIALRWAIPLLATTALFLGTTEYGIAAPIPNISRHCSGDCPCSKTTHGNPSVDREPARETQRTNSVLTEDKNNRSMPDECPADCRNCGSCLGVALTALPYPLTSDVRFQRSAYVLSLAEIALPGIHSDVFRPPRFLS